MCCAQVQLQSVDPFFGSTDTIGEMLRLSTTANGLTTLSRNLLFFCNSGTSVKVVLVNGAVDRGTVTEDLLSLIGFQYGLASTSTTVAWSFYRDSSWNAGFSNIDPLQFNKQLIGNVGVGYDLPECVSI